VDVAIAPCAIVTIEENAVMGGAGSAVSEVLRRQWGICVCILGIPDRFIEHGSREPAWQPRASTGRLTASVETWWASQNQEESFGSKRLKVEAQRGASADTY